MRDLDLIDLIRHRSLFGIRTGDPGEPILAAAGRAGAFRRHGRFNATLVTQGLEVQLQSDEPEGPLHVLQVVLLFHRNAYPEDGMVVEPGALRCGFAPRITWRGCTFWNELAPLISAAEFIELMRANYVTLGNRDPSGGMIWGPSDPDNGGFSLHAGGEIMAEFGTVGPETAAPHLYKLRLYTLNDYARWRDLRRTAPSV